MKKSIVLLSGGLDSATTLYYALDKGYQVQALIFDYGQRHRKEVRAAQAVARAAGVGFKVVKIAFPWKGSALTDARQVIPRRKTIAVNEIPSTYVPARNIIFVSYAASFAEAVGARSIFIGANAIDYSGYPDCRPEFFKAFQHTLDLGLKAGVEKRRIRIETPLVSLTKTEIIRLGMRLKVPYEKTWSCYNGRGKVCGTCDSCQLRAKGFAEAGLVDPALK